jgi:DNA-binding SARP family transcriptional activator
VTLRFHLLGPLRVTRDGVDVPIGSPKQRCVLAALLLEANRAVAVERLVSVVWDAEPPRSAVPNIRTYASRLRTQLLDGRGGPRLIRREPGYLVSVLDGELDLAVFQRLARDGRSASAGGDAELAARLLGQAAGLWRGDAAEDVTRTIALGRRLGALDEERLVVVEDWIEARQALGLHAEVLPELRRLTAAHPLRERLWVHLIRTLYQVGDVAGALQAARRICAVLAEGLGVEPGPELADLHRAVLSRDPCLTEAADLTGSAGTPPRIPPRSAVNPADLSGRETSVPATQLPRHHAAPISRRHGRHCRWS